MKIYDEEIEVDPDELRILSARELREICDALGIGHKGLTKEHMVSILYSELTDGDEDDIDIELRKEAARQGRKYR